jgi:hypothetical protein
MMRHHWRILDHPKAMLVQVGKAAPVDQATTLQVAVSQKGYTVGNPGERAEGTAAEAVEEVTLPL